VTADTSIDDLGASDNGPTVDSTDSQPDTQTEPSCTPLWSFERTEGGVPSSPVLSPDGTTGIASSNTFRRVSITGQELCVTEVPGTYMGNPSLNGAGTYFLGTSQGEVVAITKNCDVKWTSDSTNTHASAIRHAPALDGEASLYVADEHPSIHRMTDLGSNGVTDWSYLIFDDPLPNASPGFMGGNDPFVILASKHMITAVNATGSKRWAYDAIQGGDEPWEITATVVMTTAGETLTAIGKSEGSNHTDHQIVRIQAAPTPGGDAVMVDGWPKPIDLGLDTVNALVLGPDNSLFVATTAHGLVRLDSEGNELWRYVGEEQSLRIQAAPTLGDDLSVYFVAEPHYFYSVSGAGSQLFQYTSPKGGDLASTSPALHTNGHVLVHLGTQLLCYHCSASSLALSSWPRYQRNNRASGSVLEAN